ncbi:hypothetical protein OIDMADRAFT_20990 [Oidiodendron maius Zn]|uniref:Uncharacterized protein n=1 Tax=Oidiodendron maius (strain Zn) TaxID=913774 RepID=A0A0C3H138_OIDMZ|nr:hypothetical protein OIDMADRAFT_20990 [Oidiodendron maius Zn]
MMPTAVITGCNEGIGFWFARVALKQGYTTYATSRTDGPKLKQLESEGAKISVLDVSSAESIQAFKKMIGNTTIDVLINNAAISEKDQEALTVVSMSVLESVFRTNAFGPLILTQALLSNLTAVPNSRIGNISSRAGSIADNTSGSLYAYRSSKAALNMIGKSMAVDLMEKGVLVAMLHPGMVATLGSGATIGQPQVIEPQEAADKCWDLLMKKGIKDTGKFWHRDGYEIPW